MFMWKKMIQFKDGSISSFIFLIGFIIVVYITYYLVKQGRKVTIRIMPAIEALDEAVGRAAEMGRPIHATPGDSALTGAAGPQTVAGLEVCSAVARKSAQAGVPLYITTPDPVVHTLQTDIAQQAYRTEGEVFDPTYSMLFPFWTSFAVGISGLVYRENVASNICIGGWHGIVLILMETASRIGAFQIGGTAFIDQLPWFVACCDYYVLGEEVFAAGAYLSQNPSDIAAIWSQDTYKLIIVILMAIGILIAMTGSTWLADLLKI
jgi:hypothetical protein